MNVIRLRGSVMSRRTYFHTFMDSFNDSTMSKQERLSSSLWERGGCGMEQENLFPEYKEKNLRMKAIFFLVRNITLHLCYFPVYWRIRPNRIFRSQSSTNVLFIWLTDCRNVILYFLSWLWAWRVAYEGRLLLLCWNYTCCEVTFCELQCNLSDPWIRED